MKNAPVKKRRSEAELRALIKEVRRLISEGRIHSDIAQTLDLDPGYLSRLAKKNGLTFKAKGKTGRMPITDWPSVFEEAGGKMTVTDIARHIGVERTSVRKMAVKLGVALPTASLKKGIDWNAELRRAVENDETASQLSKRLGVNLSGVYHFARRHGIVLRRAAGIHPAEIPKVEDTIELRGTLLRAARAAAGMQQGEACKAAKISKRTLANAETGQSISPRTWAGLVSVYGNAGIKIDKAHGCIIVGAGSRSKQD